MKGKHFCRWHWLARQSTDVQAQAAADRLERAFPPGSQATHRGRVPKSEWPDGERWCSGCQSFVPLFYCQGSRCTGCARQAAHEKRVEATYGITPEEYERIWAAQGRRCAICRAIPRSIRFAVDHDHKSGEVRGILCKRCNHDLLGGAHDSIDLMWSALKYLLSPPASFGQVFTDKVALAALEARLAGQEVIRDGLRHAAAPEPQEPPF